MNDIKDVPYIVHEGDMARMERSNKRLWIVVLVLIALLLGSNIAWLMYESQVEEVSTTTVEQDVDTTNGGDAVVNGTGVLNIGESATEDNNN